MKKTFGKHIALLAVLLGTAAAAQADNKQLEQQVLGATPQKRQADTAAAAEDKTKTDQAKTAKRKDRALSPREDAQRMYARFNAGDSMYVTLLRDAANKGNPWASLQYGYLAHLGRIPGSKGADYALAHKAYMKAVKNPDGSLTANHLAAYNLGLLYYFGGGPIKPDGKTALKWFQTANQAFSEQKRSQQQAVFWPAAIYAANILERGHAGVAPDPKRARVYWQRAAAQRDPAALYGYGHSIFRENPYAAVNYYQRAADRWHIGAMVALAHYYAKGDKLRKADLVQATRWMQIAASVDGRYKGYAQRMMAALPENQQKQVAQSASSWLRRRGIRPEPFPYAAPLNDDPPRIL